MKHLSKISKSLAALAFAGIIGITSVHAQSNTLTGTGAGNSLTTGTYNTFNGFNAGYTTNTGGYNAALGAQALYYNTSGTYNTAMGYNAASNNTTGQQNTSVGRLAGANNQTGNYNTSVGAYAGRSVTNDDNTFVGWNCGNTTTTGYSNTAIGASAGPASSGIYNTTAVGAGSTVSYSNTMVFGSTDITNWGFGTDAASGHALQVGTTSTNGNGAYLTTGGVWTNTSDRNKKENFVTLDKNAILQNIMKLPISRWNYIGEKADVQHIGPMAQDFYSLFHVGNDNISISTIDPAGVALIGVQALNDKITALEQTNQQLQQKYDELEARLAKLEQAGNASAAPAVNGNNGAILEQNTPNPAGQSTTIRYYLPDNMPSATINVKSMDGRNLQSYPITTRGNGQIVIPSSTLAPGTYIYNMECAGKQVDVKRMVIVKQ